jgi:signal transduction histidine kinase
VDQNWREIQLRSFATQAASSTQPPYIDHPPADNPPPGGPGRSFLGLADAQGTVIVAVDPNYPAGSKLTAAILNSGTAVLVDGKQVGTILTARQPPTFNPQQARFLSRTNEALLFASLGALLVALLLGILLARTLTGPLQALTQAAHRITQGQLEQQVRVSSSDEIGQLAYAFNRMSQEVARVNQQRRQMTADIAHDLRTPLTVISGYIESMRDGVLKPTPQRLSLIYSEIERLQNLVGDLRMLSLADAGELSLNPQAMPPKVLLERAAALFRHQAEGQNVTIEVDASDSMPEICVDEARMMQILGNLICNALRYTPCDGRILLSAQLTQGKMEICVRDNGEGISPEELPYIFDRFHRSDKSRHSESGESGLGLAIVKALVESHGGSASAESMTGLGTTIQLSFPLIGEQRSATDD